MPKTKIKSIILFTAMVLVVSGCGRELGIKNEELKIKDSGEMGGLVEQVATTTGEDLGVANISEEVDKKGKKVYRNSDYGFKISYPKNWFLYDCSEKANSNIGASSFLEIHLSDTAEGDCAMPGGRINISLFYSDINNYFRKNDNYKESNLKINGIAAKRIDYDVEIKGGEGEVLEQRPLVKVISTFVPYGDNSSADKYYNIAYSEIYKFLGVPEGNNFALETNYQKIYDDIVSSFELVD